MAAPSPARSNISSPPLTSNNYTSYFASHSPQKSTNNTTQSLTTTGPPTESGQEASTKLAEAIDDFLGDLEKKFKGISDEILTKLDDMAERCDRLEQEMLVRESSGSVLEGKGAGSQAGSG